MRHLAALLALLILTGCGAGCNVEPEPPIKFAPALPVQWCTIDPVTGVATGNACPK